MKSPPSKMGKRLKVTKKSAGLLKKIAAQGHM